MWDVYQSFLMLGQPLHDRIFQHWSSPLIQQRMLKSLGMIQVLGSKDCDLQFKEVKKEKKMNIKE